MGMSLFYENFLRTCRVEDSCSCLMEILVKTSTVQGITLLQVRDFITHLRYAICFAVILFSFYSQSRGWRENRKSNQKQEKALTPQCILASGYISGWCEQNFGFPVL